jgi:cytochrome P450
MDYNALADPRTYGNDPSLHELMAHIRQHDPVAYIDAASFRPFYAISKHADIIEISRRHDVFINAPRPVLIDKAIEEAMANQPAALRTLIHMDEPDHKVFRGLTQDWFMPANLKKVEAKVESIAETFIDRLLATGGECDFVNDIAVWYPLRVIMMILGVPEKDEALMLRLTQELFGANDPDMQRDAPTEEERNKTLFDFFNFFSQITAERRAKPGDDVATTIANAHINGELIGDLEAMSYYIIVATAGHDTTSSSTAGGLLALLQHPEEMQKLRDDPSLLSLAVDEAIRWVTPVKHFMRTATEDYDLRGKTIKAGESVMLMYASGNRDEEVFDEPFKFKADRRPNKHVAFGHGAHHCLGHLLAKMEMRALYKKLLEKVQDIELVGEPAWVQSQFVSGLKTLPIKFTAN